MLMQKWNKKQVDRNKSLCYMFCEQGINATFSLLGSAISDGVFICKSLLSNRCLGSPSLRNLSSTILRYY